LIACTPDGFVADAFEFMGAESCGQRYFFLARLKEMYPDFKVTLHDDACHLRRFACARSSSSALAQSLAHPNMHYVLDRFHASGHTDLWCKEHVHPKCAEHAHLVEGLNSSRCEILFSWLRKYKHMFRTMNRWLANFFVQEILDQHNTYRGYSNTSRVAPPTLAASTSSSSSSSESASDSDSGS
jgi:hypothetical protein